MVQTERSCAGIFCKFVYKWVMLCSHSKKLCLQRRMDNFGFCVKHILEDPNAPWAQCEHVTKTKNKTKQCTMPVPLKEEPPRYCSAHKQLLGLAPKKSVKKQKKAPEPEPVKTKETKQVLLSHRKLGQLISKQGLGQEALKDLRYWYFIQKLSQQL